MALGDLTPLAPLGPDATSASSPPPASTSGTAGSRAVVTSTAPSAEASAAANAAAARVTREEGLIACRRQATSGEMYGLLAYLAVLMLFAVYSLFTFWPRPTPTEQIPRGADSVATSTARAAAPPLTDTARARTDSVRGAATQGSAPGPAATRSTAATAAAADSAAIDACDARQVADLLRQVRGDSLRSQLISICYFQRPRIIWKETQLVLLVLFGGGVGAILSCLRKSTQHFYKGDLCAEGLPGLYVWPFSGALTALVFYAIIRGGFFSGQSTISQTSPYSFVAAALLSGMFTHEVVAKLRQVAETLLTSVNTRPTVPVGSPGAATGTVDTKAAADTDDGGEMGEMKSAPAPASTPPASPPGTVG